MTKHCEQGAITPKAWLYCALMCTISGTTFLAIKIGSNAGVPPFLAVSVRFTSAGTILLLTRGRIWSRAHLLLGALLWRTAVLGLLMIGFAVATLSVGLLRKRLK